MKWTAGVLLAFSAAGVAAKQSTSELMKQAIKATQGVPSLRKKEAERQRSFKTTMQGFIQPKRSLQNNYNYNNAQNYQGYWNGNDYDYQWNQDMAEEEFGFDISQYSIKFTGCHAVETYNEELAANDQFETVLGNQRYATFRLCPADTCNANTKWGCSENFGEYVVPLDMYVKSIAQYGQQRVQAYCEFCEDCAAREAYRSFAVSQMNQMQYELQVAEELYESFKENYVAQQGANNANGGNGGYYYNADLYNDDANEQNDADILMAYYKNVRNNANNNNGNNNGNNNVNGYYNANQNGYQNPRNSYNYYNQNMWKFSNNNNNNQNQNGDNQNQYKQNMNNNADYWNFATFEGHPLLPGYFSNQGEFVQSWGYFLNGEFVSIEEMQVAWDENLFGELPAGWENYIGLNPDEIEQCEYQYSKNCYSVYDQCMVYMAAEMEDDNWIPDWMNENYDANNANSNSAMASYIAYLQANAQNQENQYLALTGQMFGCHQVLYEPGCEGAYCDGNYEEQQYNNAQFYQLNKYMEAQLEACGEDEYCIADIETQMQQNQDFVEWLQEYNEKLYDQYINGEKLFYIGATCDENGGIGLAVYNDENCAYQDASLTAEQVLGFDVADLDYELIPDQCVPCDNQDNMQDKYYFGEDNQDADCEGCDQYEFEEGISSMCSMLYQISGKCNENLQPQNLYDGYYQDGEYIEPSYNNMFQSYSQQQNEELVCSFVESLNSGTYDQSGQVYIDNSKWGSPAKWQQGIAQASRNMPGGLKAALFLTALAAALMGVWACMLHGALARKNIPWQPKRSGAGGDAVDVARQNSGIVMGRSRSGPVTHPLI